MQIIHQRTKTLHTRDNGRSSDAVSPNFVYGCLGGCMSSYCYVGRYNNDRVYINENTDQILESVYDWIEKQQWPKIPNQTDPEFYTIDIGVSTDVPLHLKYYPWQAVFNFFNEYYKAKSTFATKYPSMMLKKIDEYQFDIHKHRIRISLMPQAFSDILEPNTESIESRISCIPALQEQMEVHINFSPIVYYPGWKQQYEKLFKQLKDFKFQSECIFLTYNKIQYQRNSKEVNGICWNPQIQESKNSQYAADNIRYRWDLKAKMIEEFKQMYSYYFDLSTIRYIF